MQFMLRFLRIMRDYALMLAATNYAQYYAGIMYASLVRGATHVCSKAIFGKFEVIKNSQKGQFLCTRLSHFEHIVAKCGI